MYLWCAFPAELEHYMMSLHLVVHDSSTQLPHSNLGLVGVQFVIVDYVVTFGCIFPQNYKEKG